MAWYGIAIYETTGKIRRGIRWADTEDLSGYKEHARTMAAKALNGTFAQIIVKKLPDNHPDVLESIKKRRAYYEEKWRSEGKYTGKEKIGYREL